MRNVLLVLSGPSGVGKGTIVNELLKRGNFALSISCTTRAPRRGEKEGVAYFFKTRPEFEEMIERGELLEYDEHFENYYGTPKNFVDEQLATHDVILEIEVEGALQVKASHPAAILMMVTPPSVRELRARLVGRGSENAEKIEKRIARMDYELSKTAQYDYVVVNDDLERAVREIEHIIEKEKSKND